MMKYLFILLIGFVSTATHAQSDGCLTLYTPEELTGSGEQLCIPIKALRFDNVVSMQFTLRWDPALLEWGGWSAGAIADLTGNNFGLVTQQLNDGILTFSWIQPSLQGVSLPDSAVIFNVCFEVTGASNAQGSLYFDTAPAVPEFVNADFEEIKSFSLVGGGISVGGTVPPSISDGCSFSLACSADMFNISPTVNGGIPNYTYTWTGPNGYSNTTASINGVASGFYQLIVTDVTGAMSTALISANQQSFYVSADVTAGNCAPGNTGAIDIAVEGAAANDSYTYEWSNGATSQDIANLTPGTYYLTLTNNTSGCVLQDSFIVGQQIAVSYEATVQPATCSPGEDGEISLVFNGEQPQQLAWSTGDTAAVLTNLAPGNYSVTITDAYGCMDDYSFTVNQSGLLSVQATVNGPGCDGAEGNITLQLPSTGGPFSILWSQGDTTAQLTGLTGGNYSVTVTGAGNCTYQQTYYLPAPGLVVGTSYECVVFSDTVLTTITSLVWGGGVPPYTFHWSTGQETVTNDFSSIVVGYPGSYSFTVTDNSGCEFTDIVTPSCITGDTINMFTAYSYNCTWLGNEWTTDITLAVWAGGQPPYTFLWSTGEVTTGELFSTINVPADGSYSVTIVDSEGNTYFPEPPSPQCGQNSAVSLYYDTPSTQVAPGGEICLDVKANGFNEIVSAQFSLQWDTSYLEWVGVEPVDLPGVDINNFGTNPDWIDQGKLSFSWIALNTQTGGTYSLSDGSTLFQVCLQARNDAEGTTPVSFGSEPTPFEIIGLGDVSLSYSSQSVDIQIGDSNPPMAEVELQIGEAVAGVSQSVCIPVSAIRFDEILSMQFSIAWDTSLIHFDHVNGIDLPGVGSGNFGLTFANVGHLSFSWFDPTLMGVSLAEGEELFEVCFQTQGILGSAPVSFDNFPTPVECVNINDQPLTFYGAGGEVTVTDLVVWPGDTDNNELANHFDLLPIGLAYGAMGPERPNASIDWTGQYAHAWNQTTPQSQVDFAHIDTNGDGVINAADTLALVQNWGSETGFTSGTPPVNGFNGLENFLTGIPLYVQTDTLVAGDTAILDIILGEEGIPADNIYGLAFSIVYDPDIVVAGSVSAYFNPSWIGQIGNNLLAVAREDVDNHRIDIAVTRIDGNNTSGFGVMGQLQVTIEDVIFSRSAAVDLHLGIENVRIINFSEEPIPSTPIESVILINTITGTDDATIASDIRVFPNPVGESLNLDTKKWIIEDASLFNAAGKQIGYWNRPGATLALGHLLPGWYKLALTTEQGVVYFSIIKK